MPKLITYLLISANVIILTQGDSVRHTIKKCCPIGQFLNSNMGCSYLPSASDKRVKFKYVTNDTVGIRNENETHVLADGISPKRKLTAVEFLRRHGNIISMVPVPFFNEFINFGTNFQYGSIS